MPGPTVAPVGIALPADLDRSLRLPDDAQLDRLMRSVRAEAQRRGRDDPTDAPGPVPLTSEPAGAKSNARKQSPAVTPGQDRSILASFEAGLRPAAIAKEVRVSRATIQHVINAAKRDRRTTGR